MDAAHAVLLLSSFLLSSAALQASALRWPGFVASVFAVALHASCSAAAPAAREPAIALWAWSRSDDLGFINELAPSLRRPNEIAWLAGELIVARHRVYEVPRTRTLRLPRQLPLTAVAYVQIARLRRARLQAVEIEQLARSIAALPRLRDAARVQLNFEALQSQRADWQLLVLELRRQLPPLQPLDVTALADWCMQADFAPTGVERVIPMLYRLGEITPVLARVLDGDAQFPAVACRASIGVAADELQAVAPALLRRAERVYLFSSPSWTRGRYQRALAALQRD